MKKSVKIALSALLVMVLTVLPVEQKTSADSNKNIDYLKITSEENIIVPKWQKAEDIPQNITLGTSGGKTRAGTYSGGVINTGRFILSEINSSMTPNGKVVGVDNYDFLSTFNLNYDSTVNEAITGGTLQIHLWFPTDDPNNPPSRANADFGVTTEANSINLFTSLSSTPILNRTYILQFKYASGFTSHIENVAITFDSIESTITPDPASHSTGYNPKGFTGASVYGHPDNSANTGNIIQTWEITGPNGYSKTVTGPNINSIFIYDVENVDHLLAGEYTVTLKGAGKTVNGTTIPPEYITGASTTFKVRYPESTTTVDKQINPTNIKGSKTITDSTLGWQLVNEDGSAILPSPTTDVSGTGELVPTENYTNLPPGKYKVIFTEKSPEGLEHSSEGLFEILIRLQ